MTSFVIDASAWVEYFNGSSEGEQVKDIVENTQNKIDTDICGSPSLGYVHPEQLVLLLYSPEK